jgi:hypothetical protein
MGLAFVINGFISRSELERNPYPPSRRPSPPAPAQEPPHPS